MNDAENVAFLQHFSKINATLKNKLKLWEKKYLNI